LCGLKNSHTPKPKRDTTVEVEEMHGEKVPLG
jgi:hypothetical protein